jgi:hypothetical protein
MVGVRIGAVELDFLDHLVVVCVDEVTKLSKVSSLAIKTTPDFYAGITSENTRDFERDHLVHYQ